MDFRFWASTRNAVLKAMARSAALRAIAALIILTTIFIVSPTTAQLTPTPNLQLPSPGQIIENLDSQVVSSWVTLDGRRLFQIAAPRTNLSQRLDNIQQRLRNISQNYFQSNSEQLQIEIQKENNLPVIYVNNQSLLTVTDQDAKLQQQDPFKLAQTLSKSLEQALKTAKQERQTTFLVRQSKVTVGILLAVFLCSWGIRNWQRRVKLRSITASTPTHDPVTRRLSEQQQRNLQEVRQRLFQLAQGIVWGSAILIILGLFPYTRIIQAWVLRALKIPFILAIVWLGTYVVIRFSYVLIDRFTTVLVNNALLTVQDPLRLQLRVTTISGVTKSIATLICLVIGTLIALTTLGVNIVPLLAGAGLIGVGVSLASQSLIKDAINGFLIILEDQYAVGDVIAVGQVAGFVENLNLRITQLRDAEGRLITIPNSEIKIVANLSSRWSRADLNIPVAYDTNIDQALQLINSVGVQMDQDQQWQEQILETPQVLGVENFGDRGLVIRVWIKTQPLKQWEVAREYRRRIKIAFDKAGIAIPVPQQTVWLNDNQWLKSERQELDAKRSD